MRTKAAVGEGSKPRACEAAVVEGIKPCYYQQKIKIELKCQQPWTAVSALLGLISMPQLADELWVPT